MLSLDLEVDFSKKYHEVPWKQLAAHTSWLSVAHSLQHLDIWPKVDLDCSSQCRQPV